MTLSFETIQQKRYLMFLVVYREVIGALLLQLVFTQLLLLLSPRLTYTVGIDEGIDILTMIYIQNTCVWLHIFCLRPFFQCIRLNLVHGLV